MNRLAKRLEWCRKGKRLFLAGFLPAGYPTGRGFTDCIRSAFESGIDAMEIALPNPPLPLDGPLIQQAAVAGAAQVSGPADALRRAVRGRTDESQAIIALAYRHAFDALGADGLIELCVKTDVDAVLMPEHSMAEQLSFSRRSRAAGLEQVIFLYLEDDLQTLASSGLRRPVIYLQSADLNTGGRFDPGKARERLGEVRTALDGCGAFVLVGFGVKGPQEIATLGDSIADGAIIGTALVEAAGQGAACVRSLIDSVQPVLPKGGAEVVGHG